MKSTHLDDLELQRHETTVRLSIRRIFILLLLRRRLGQPRLHDIEQEGIPLLQHFFRKALDSRLVILHDHLERIEATSEHAAGQCPQRRLYRLVNGHILHDLDQLFGHTKELFLVEAIFHQLAQHFERAMQLSLRGIRDEGEEVREQVGPVLGVVGGSNLAHDQSSGSFKLAIELVSGREFEEGLSELRFVLLCHQNAALELVGVQAFAPSGEHELLEIQQGGLPYVEGHALMAGDLDKGDGEVLVVVEALQLLLGLLAGAFLGGLRRGEQLH